MHGPNVGVTRQFFADLLDAVPPGIQGDDLPANVGVGGGAVSIDGSIGSGFR